MNRHYTKTPSLSDHFVHVSVGFSQVEVHIAIAKSSFPLFPSPLVGQGKG